MEHNISKFHYLHIILIIPTQQEVWLQLAHEKDDESPTWDVLADLVYFFGDEEEDDMSDLLLSICLIPSATLTAGLDLNLPQNDMCALTASSMPNGCLLPLPTSSLTASEHNPHSHFPSNFAFTCVM